MKNKNTTSIHPFEVIIIGGSYAGLSAAMSLGRSLRKVLIIDRGLPCNRSTPKSHNFLTQDGEAPAAISELSKKQVLTYNTVEIRNDLATSCERHEDTFRVETESGETYLGKKVLFATGIKDLLPKIEGLSACWGKSVIHCPYCHGYEYHGKKTGILANGEAAIHLTKLVSNLTQDLTIFTNGPTDLTSEQTESLGQRNIDLIETPLKTIKHQEGYINHLDLEDGSIVQIDALYARVPFQQNCKLPKNMGCELNEHGFISINNFQETNIEGVFAAGDNSSGMRSLANAIAAGSLAGAIINGQLCDEDFGSPMNLN